MPDGASKQQHWVEAILWDLDGTLISNEGFYCEATRRVLVLLGHRVETVEIQRRFYEQGVDPLEELAKQDGCAGSADFSVLHAERKRIYNRMLMSDACDAKGMDILVHLLSLHYRQVVVTGSIREHYDLIASRFSFFECFDFAVTYNDVHKSKPAPDGYFAAIDRLGLQPCQCLAIEDSQMGLKSAKNAGLCCWVLPNTVTCGSDFSSADKVLSSPVQLRSLLLADTRG